MSRLRPAGGVRVAVSLAVASVGVLAIETTASAQVGCSSYATYSAVGSAAGLKVVESAPGVTVTDTADSNLPAAQAQFDSVLGSIGWAGAPYSAAAGDNVGAADLATNDVPVFVRSSYPSEPQASKSQPGMTLDAQSGAASSSALAVVGAASPDMESGTGERANAHAICHDDGTLEATSKNVAEGLDVGGVLRIGSVRSSARALIDPSGKRDVQGTMVVESVTVLGQPASITDDGVVVGTSVIPYAENPFTQTLAEAGITLHYVAAVEDQRNGSVLAPGLQIVLTQQAPGVGSGPATTTYVLGQAYARADFSPDRAPAPAGVVPIVPFTSAAAPAAPPTADLVIDATPTIVTPGAPAVAQDRSLLTARIANWSIVPAYSALAVGALLFVAVWLVLGKPIARYRWT